MISRIAKLIQEYEQTLQDAISLADIFKRNPILVERFVDAVAGSIGFVEAKEAKEAKEVQLNTNTEVIARGLDDKNRCWLAMHKHTTKSENGKDRNYFFVTRGDKVIPPDKKRPDAVVVIGFVGEGEDMRIVLTDEYRLPIGRREIGSVAGLIDSGDYDCSPALFCGKNMAPVASAACRAATREFHEETGLKFTPFEVSADNLYSTAGMTDESVCMVIGKASGTPSKEFLEDNEDINTMMLNRQEVIELMNRRDVAFSKHVWPFLWMIKHYGFPELLCLSPLKFKVDDLVIVSGIDSKFEGKILIVKMIHQEGGYLLANELGESQVSVDEKNISFANDPNFPV